MTSIGTGYDLSNSVFSPDGRVFQVEYASKAVENASTTLGIRYKDGVVLAVEKIIGSKLLKPDANKRIQSVDKHVGVVYSGLLPDGRHVVQRGRDEARQWRDQFREPIPTSTLANNVASYVQAYTLYNSVRPFGISTILGGYNEEEGAQLYMVEPNGTSWGYLGAAAGRGKQLTNNELEKLDFKALSGKEAVKEAARILYIAHEDSKDKAFQPEIAWIGKETNGEFREVPEDLMKEAVEYAEESFDVEDE